MAASAATITYLLFTSFVYLATPPCIKAEADSPAAAPPPGPDCFTSIVNVTDCLSYVDNGSKQKKPDAACCPELAGLIESQPICLCRLLSNSTEFGVSIDVNRAVRLPSLCNIHTSADSLCAGFNNASPNGLSPIKQHFLIGVALFIFTYIH